MPALSISRSNLPVLLYRSPQPIRLIGAQTKMQRNSVRMSRAGTDNGFDSALAKIEPQD
jgi:hypothetical protein